MSTERRVKVGGVFDREQVDYLTERAARADTSVSTVLRQIVRDAMQREQAKEGEAA